MKKILLASTALVMTAGIAAAEIKLSGSAEMGIVGGGNDNINFATDGETQFHNDLTLSVEATGETDTGLSFGVSFDFSKEDEGNENGNIVLDNEAAFISGAYGTLTLGEIDGAMDWAITETTGNPGTIGDDETMHAGYLGAFGDGAYDNQILRYDYAMGDFAFAVSAEMDDTGERDAGYAVGVKYNTDMGGIGLGLGLAYQSFELGNSKDGATAIVSSWLPGNIADFAGVTSDTSYTLDGIADVDVVAVSATADFNNGFKAGIAYSDWQSEVGGVTLLDFTQTQISAGYETGPYAIGANYGIYDIDNGPEIEGWGIAASYDLGGGAKVHAGYADSDADGVDRSFETWSLGVAMSF
ncbi:porin [Rhodobacter veldkampii DSM 11550]|uniref:Porin n=1 Tax=Phaeovulum veldkampii DSM 11550 TaxID=1185920 RepID=A0A2T4JHT1_9RHOB|nr:porin [Phaeovulum veldkampii]MBK5947109.1 porin [Phaeovulum veldkampii DSM 11550]PTE17471.1 porin [Phaeovulum veldkampii DSM 11550]TDQ60133.1 outer membrane protein OmpU [Phaeovulum veldkampii DSM 11550]